MSEQSNIAAFRREARYIVFKLKDVARHLNEMEISELHRIGYKLAYGREMEGKQPFNAVVVEQDWPEFEMVWASIEARMARDENEVRG